MKGIPQGDIITQQFIVKKQDELLNFLIENKVRKSKNATQSVLRRRLITVNGKLITQFDHPLRAGDKVAVMKTDQAKKIKRLKGMSIIYEDEYLIVVDKESGMLSVGTDKEKLRTVTAILSEHVKKKKRDGQLFVLHRLDREASGLMVFGKDMDIQRKFQYNWEMHVPVYNFTAIVEGAMPTEVGVIESWLTQNKNYQVFSANFDNGGQHALTHYKVLKANERYSMLKLRLETRIRNQARAQLQFLQHPIVGDRKYGAASNPIKRVALHVGEMKVKHPVSGRLMHFKSTVPKIITKLLTSKLNDDE